MLSERLQKLAKLEPKRLIDEFLAPLVDELMATSAEINEQIACLELLGRLLNLKSRHLLAKIKGNKYDQQDLEQELKTAILEASSFCEDGAILKVAHSEKQEILRTSVIQKPLMEDRTVKQWRKIMTTPLEFSNSLILEKDNFPKISDCIEDLNFQLASTKKASLKDFLIGSREDKKRQYISYFLACLDIAKDQFGVDFAIDDEGLLVLLKK